MTPVLPGTCPRTTPLPATQQCPLCLGAVDDVDKGRLQASTADEEAVNVGLLAELHAVLLADAAAVQDAGLVGGLGVDLLLEPLADGGVDLLGLLGGGDLAGADGPDGLVGDDDLGPVGADLGLEGVELLGDDGDGLAGLALLERLAAAPDDAQPAVGGDLGLGRDHLVRLAQDRATLAVAQDRPGHVAVLELLHRDLARVGAVGLVVDVLCCHLDVLVQRVTNVVQVQCWWRNDDLCCVKV